MMLTLVRRWFTDQSTIGELYLDGAAIQTCFTLEDMVRPVKVHGETAIPAGRYQVIITESARFKRALPLLLNVPGFEGIRIHPGNTKADTEGCLLVGTQRGTDVVLKSKAAFTALFGVLQAALKKEKVWLTIVERPELSLPQASS